MFPTELSPVGGCSRTIRCLVTYVEPLGIEEGGVVRVGFRLRTNRMPGKPSRNRYIVKVGPVMLGRNSMGHPEEEPSEFEWITRTFKRVMLENGETPDSELIFKHRKSSGLMQSVSLPRIWVRVWPNENEAERCAPMEELCFPPVRRIKVNPKSKLED